MSGSPESTRTRLIREMARDMNKLRSASGSTRGISRGARTNTDSTASSFDPDNEAIVSTRPLDIHAKPLPELRDSAKKYRYPRKAEPEVQINTSAIHRAFPDFTQGPSSGNESMSIEMGRSYPANKDNREANSSLMDFGAGVIEDSIQHDSNFMPADSFPHMHNGSNNDVAYSPAPNSENNTIISQSTQPAPSGFSTAKDLVHRLTNGKQNKLYAQTGRSASQRSTNNPHPQLSADITDMPNLSELVSGVYEDGTPVFSATSARNTFPPQKYGRRSKLNHVELASIPTPDDEQAIYISLKLLQEKVAALEASKVDDAAAMASLRAENESLIREKYDRQRNKRSDSALGSTSGSDAGDEAGFGVRKVMIEKARLESRLQRVQEELKQATNKYQISSENIRSITYERDSATNQLGVAYLTTERLKAEVRTLQDENEQLKSQLAVALEANVSRNEGMSYVGAGNSHAGPTPMETSHRDAETNDQDRTELFDFNVNNVAETKDLSLPENKREHASIPPSTRIPKASREVHSRPLAQPDGVKAMHRRPETRAKSVTYDEPLHTAANTTIPSGISKYPHNTYLGHENTSHNARNDASRTGRYASNKSNATVVAKAPGGPRSTTTPLTRANLPADMTILSDEDGSGIELFPEVRAMLEEARRAKKHVRECRQAIAEENSSRPYPGGPSFDDLAALGRRSSKDASKRLSMPVNLTQDEEQTNLTGISRATSNARRHSEHSLLEQHRRQKGFTMEDMTSAYIVPDITLRHAGTAAESQPTTKKQPERVTERHAKSCDICHRILEHGKPHEHKKISIPKPIPASERGLSPTPSNPDPTMRPSESVGLSLARVIKALNDEVHIIKEKLKVLESASHNDDPGISKRQRVERERQITMLRKAKNSKSDQVYYLMNVLEGQKSAGQEMTQDEVEVTLQSVGVDSSQLDLKLGAAEDADQAFDESVVIDDDLSDFNPIDSDPPPKPKPKRSVIDGNLSERIGGGPIKSALKKNTMHAWDDLSETEELPFEGFESTGHTTSHSRRSSGSRHRRQPST